MLVLQENATPGQHVRIEPSGGTKRKHPPQTARTKNTQNWYVPKAPKMVRPSTMPETQKLHVPHTYHIEKPHLKRVFRRTEWGGHVPVPPARKNRKWRSESGAGRTLGNPSFQPWPRTQTRPRCALASHIWAPHLAYSVRHFEATVT